MIYKSIVSCKLFLFFSLLILTACGEQRQAELPERVRLTVAMDDDMPGYFVFGGENYGYQYDLFKAYADYRGLELQVVQGLSASERSEKLALGELDFVTALTAPPAPGGGPPLVVLGSLRRKSPPRFLFTTHPMFCWPISPALPRRARRNISTSRLSSATDGC